MTDVTKPDPSPLTDEQREQLVFGVMEKLEEAAAEALDELSAAGMPPELALSAVAGRSLKSCCTALFMLGQTNRDIRKIFYDSIPRLRTEFEKAAGIERRRIILPGELQ